MNAKGTTFFDEDGEVVSIEVRCGKKRKTFRVLEFGSDEDMACSTVVYHIAGSHPALGEAAHAEDRPDAFFADPLNTAMNDGLTRIKDAIFGNTREDRMTLFDLSQ